MPMTSHECGNWIFCVFVHTHTHIMEMHVRINHSPQKMGRKMPSGNEQCDADGTGMHGVDWKKKYICEKVMPCLHVALRKIIENNSACRTLYQDFAGERLLCYCLLYKDWIQSIGIIELQIIILYKYKQTDSPATMTISVILFDNLYVFHQEN